MVKYHPITLFFPSSPLLKYKVKYRCMKVKEARIRIFPRKGNALPFSFTNFAICNPQNRDEDRDSII